MLLQINAFIDGITEKTIAMDYVWQRESSGLKTKLYIGHCVYQLDNQPVFCQIGNVLLFRGLNRHFVLSVKFFLNYN